MGSKGCVSWLCAALVLGACGTQEQSGDAGARPDARPGDDDIGRSADASVDAGSDPGDPIDASVVDAAAMNFNLDYTTSTGGSITLSINASAVATCPEDSACASTVSGGSNVFLSATNGSLSFCRWEGDCTGGQSLCAFTMDQDKSVNAIFAAIDADCP